jgi:hypothetical protein
MPDDNISRGYSGYKLAIVVMTMTEDGSCFFCPHDGISERLY